MENRKQLIALAVLLAIAIPALYYFKQSFWGSNASAAPSISSATPQTKPGLALPGPDASDPRLRTDILDASRKVKYEAGGRNIFTMEADIPKIDNSPRVAKSQEVPFWTPTPTPPPPPIPINYYGFASKPGEPKKVFLQQKSGDATIFVVAQGDIVSRRYRLVQIATNFVTMEDMITGNRQDIKLTVR
jgi:hypothetical protein